MEHSCVYIDVVLLIIVYPWSRDEKKHDLKLGVGSEHLDLVYGVQNRYY